MKKLFIVLAVASLGFVACNNETETEKTADSTTNVIDSAANAATQTIDSAANAATQTIDSAANAVVDSLKK